METNILTNDTIDKQQQTRINARAAAINVKELIKGLTTDQQDSGSNALKTAEELANYILELTGKKSDIQRIKEFCIDNHTHLEVTEEPVVQTNELFKFLDTLEDINYPKPLIYVAIPYSHENSIVEEYRYWIATKYTGYLMKEGFHAFSPITHSHPINRSVNLTTNWDFWETYDRVYLEYAHKLIVLMIHGWEESTGVQAEIKIAEELGIEIEYVTQEDVNHQFNCEIN